MTSQPRDYTRFLRQLKQVRQFLPTAVPEDVVNDILEVARWTGTAANRQHWEVVVVRKRETLDALGALGRPSSHLALANVGLVLAMSGDNEEWQIYDEGRLAERIMLAAHAHGVGAGIGWILGEKVAEARQLLNILEDRRVRTAISLGYVDGEARKARPKNDQPRKPLADFVHYERF